MAALSVVTVVKDLVAGGRADAFRRGMAALRAQAWLDYEHVIWDGASTDGTADLLAELPGASVHSGPDSGIYDAMNKGAALARGTFLLFYNSDDLILGEDRLVRAVARLSDTGADYLYGQKVVERADGTHRTWRRMSPDNVLHMVPFGHGSLITTRALFEDLGGLSTDYRVYSDYDFMFRMIARGARGVQRRGDR